MKKNLHSVQYPTKVMLSNGSVVTFPFACLNNRKHSFLLEIDSLNHPFWNYKQNLGLLKSTRLSSFKKRFKNSTLFSYNKK